MTSIKTHWSSTDAMRPTQGAVGYLEVQLKMQELRERCATPGALEKYLKSHPIPAVHGPDGRMYLTDHHHMGLALVNLAEEWDADENPAAKNPYRACSFQIAYFSDRGRPFRRDRGRRFRAIVDAQGMRASEELNISHGPVRCRAGLREAWHQWSFNCSGSRRVPPLRAIR